MHKTTRPRALVVFATWHGQTQHIAERATEVARHRGYVVDLMSAKEARRCTELTVYDRIVVCAGVHMGRHHRDAAAFVREHVVPLTAQHSALISVSLAAAAPSGSTNRSQGARRPRPTRRATMSSRIGQSSSVSSAPADSSSTI